MKGDVQHLAFSDNTFDYILTTEVFEHLPDPYMAMKEIRRVAKKRAYLIISVPFEPFFRWGNVVRGKYWKKGGRTPAHIHFWTQSQFRAFLLEFTKIQESCSYSTFPWLLFLCCFKE
jgi:ubiquinone/menaquinone biosynthesis C-methylase UbiE